MWPNDGVLALRVYSSIDPRAATPVTRKKSNTEGLGTCTCRHRAICNMYRVDKRMFGSPVCDPDRCQLDRRQLQTLLPAFNDQGIAHRHQRAASHLE